MASNNGLHPVCSCCRGTAQLSELADRLSFARTREKEWLSPAFLAGRGFLQLFVLITGESPAWLLFTGRLPNFLLDSGKVIPIERIWQSRRWHCHRFLLQSQNSLAEGTNTYITEKIGIENWPLMGSPTRLQGLITSAFPRALLSHGLNVH